MRKIMCITTICILIAAIFSGCGILQKLGLAKNENDELHPVSSIVMNEDEARKLSDKVPIHLYFANSDNTKLKLEIRYIPLSEAKKSVNNLAAIIVKELIKGPGADTGLKPVIPPGTQLKSPVKINAGIATVNFSREFIDRHPGGKAAEQMTIFSVVNSLTELKEIEKVKFLIESKTRKDLKGNFQFDVPFPRSISLIGKEPSPKGNTKKKDSKPAGSIDSEDVEVNQDIGSDEGGSEETHIDFLE